MSVRGLIEKVRRSREARRVRKLERAVARRGEVDTRPPIVPQGSTLTPPVSDDWK
jgi:hypothetical protein